VQWRRDRRLPPTFEEARQFTLLTHPPPGDRMRGIPENRVKASSIS